MRIATLSFDNKTATLEDGRVVDVSHQSFCSYEMFGSGHDEECECLDFDEEGSSGELTDDEIDARDKAAAARKAANLRRLREHFKT